MRKSFKKTFSEFRNIFFGKKYRIFSKVTLKHWMLDCKYLVVDERRRRCCLLFFLCVLPRLLWTETTVMEEPDEDELLE